MARNPHKGDNQISMSHLSYSSLYNVHLTNNILKYILCMTMALIQSNNDALHQRQEEEKKMYHMTLFT